MAAFKSASRRYLLFRSWDQLHAVVSSTQCWTRTGRVPLTDVLPASIRRKATRLGPAKRTTTIAPATDWLTGLVTTATGVTFTMALTATGKPRIIALMWASRGA